MNEQSPKGEKAIEDLDVTPEDAGEIKGGLMQPPVKSLKAGASEVLMDSAIAKKGPGLG